MSNDPHWNKVAAEVLKGRTIKEVRYMTPKEAQDSGFHSRPVVLELDNGTYVYPMMDDEGNDGGALGTSSKKHPTLPTL